MVPPRVRRRRDRRRRHSSRWPAVPPTCFATQAFAAPPSLTAMRSTTPSSITGLRVMSASGCAARSKAAAVIATPISPASHGLRSRVQLSRTARAGASSASSILASSDDWSLKPGNLASRSPTFARWSPGMSARTSSVGDGPLRDPAVDGGRRCRRAASSDGRDRRGRRPITATSEGDAPADEPRRTGACAVASDGAGAPSRVAASTSRVRGLGRRRRPRGRRSGSISAMTAPPGLAAEHPGDPTTPAELLHELLHLGELLHEAVDLDDGGPRAGRDPPPPAGVEDVGVAPLRPASSSG